MNVPIYIAGYRGPYVPADHINIARTVRLASRQARGWSAPMEPNATCASCGKAYRRRADNQRACSSACSGKLRSSGRT